MNFMPGWLIAPFTVLHKDKIVLHPYSQFIPKVISDFHVNQFITLPVYFPKLHSNKGETKQLCLDSKRVLLFYLVRPKDLRLSHRLYVSYAGNCKGNPISAQK